jgi:hypothetical protein
MIKLKFKSLNQIIKFIWLMNIFFLKNRLGKSEFNLCKKQFLVKFYLHYSRTLNYKELLSLKT